MRNTLILTLVHFLKFLEFRKIYEKVVVKYQRPFNYQWTPAPRNFTTFSPATFFQRNPKKSTTLGICNKLTFLQSTSPEKKFRSQSSEPKSANPKLLNRTYEPLIFWGGVFLKNVFSWNQVKILLNFFWRGEDYFYIQIFSWIRGDSFS